MTLLLPGWPVEDSNVQAKFDTISREWYDRSVGVFSVWRSGALTAATSVDTQVVFDTEEFDRSSWYDTATGRYTPKIAGYYRLNAAVGINQAIAAGTRLVVMVFKNGVAYKYLSTDTVSSGSDAVGGGSCLVQADGVADYFSVYLHQNSGGNLAVAQTAVQTYMQGECVVP